MIDGTLEGLDPMSALLVASDTADDWGLEVGDEVSVNLTSGETLAVTVGAVFAQTRPPFWDEWIIDESLHRQTAGADLFDQWVAVNVDGDDPEASRALLDEVLSAYPQATLEDRQEFQASLESNLNTLLALVNVFLLFALVVALVGIVNTLTLSVFERTHEIGLLRAVGMTRRQLRRAIRWEAAAISLYGALVGVVLGLGFGVALSVAIPDDAIDRVSVPSGSDHRARGCGRGLRAAGGGVPVVPGGPHERPRRDSRGLTAGERVPEMFKLALRSLIDKKLRFALTTFVVVLGVMFVVGSFTLTDSLRSTFSGLAQDIAKGADLTVRVDQEFGGDFERATVPEAVAEQVAGVEGVGPGAARAGRPERVHRRRRRRADKASRSAGAGLQLQPGLVLHHRRPAALRTGRVRGRYRHRGQQRPADR